MEGNLIPSFDIKKIDWLIDWLIDTEVNNVIY